MRHTQGEGEGQKSAGLVLIFLFFSNHKTLDIYLRYLTIWKTDFLS